MPDDKREDTQIEEDRGADRGRPVFDELLQLQDLGVGEQGLVLLLEDVVGGRDEITFEVAGQVSGDIIGRQGLSYFSPELDTEIRSRFENMVPGEVLIPEGW